MWRNFVFAQNFAFEKKTEFRFRNEPKHKQYTHTQTYKPKQMFKYYINEEKIKFGKTKENNYISNR